MFKIVFVGDSGVGKTSLTRRYCEDRFDERARSTVGIDFTARTTERGSKLSCWDTAGQERYRSMAAAYYRRCHAIVFVYDASRASATFGALEQHWFDEAEQHAPDDALRVLVANKCDGASAAPLDRARIDVAVRERRLAHVAEVSARTGDGVAAFFDEIERALLDRPIAPRDEQHRQPTRCCH